MALKPLFVNFYGSIIYSVGEKSPALFLYTQIAMNFLYHISDQTK